MLYSLFFKKRKKKTGLLIFSSLLFLTCLLTVTEKKISDSCKGAKTLADNRKSYHAINTFLELMI